MNLIRVFASFLLFTILTLCGSRAAPLGSAFTYQGRLTEGGSAATGLYDFQFVVYDAPSGGSQQGSTVLKEDVPVTNGAFTVDIDIGPNHFTGSARWLEIGVRAGASSAGYSTLSPRQALTAAPYSLYALNAGVATSAGAAPWSGLTGVPAGFLDGLDNDTIYSAGLGLGLSGTTFSLNSAYTDSLYWKLAGNSGTSPGVNFLGTTDSQPLDFRVNNARALRLFAGDVGPNHLGGHPENAISDGAGGAVIAGGGEAGGGNGVSDRWGFIGGGSINRVGNFNGDPGDATYGTIAGGVLNSVLAYGATVGGGQENTASLTFATVAGGRTNIASGFASSVGGGNANVASGGRSVVGGGFTNMATGLAATVPGGRENTAAANYSFAAGRRAKAQHAGTFVWADSTDSDFTSTAPNQFLIRAAKVGIGTATPQTTLDVAGPIRWGTSELRQDQGGSIELGDSLSLAGAPYLDFHFGTGVAEDFNARLINDMAGRLTVDTGTLRITGNVGIGLDAPSAPLEVAGPIKAGSFVGDGSGLTLLDANRLVTGIVAEARIDPLLARDSEILPTILAGDGTGSALDADLLDGLDSSAFASASHNHDSTYWKRTGNAGTVPGTDFLGTTDNQALELKANGARALRLEPDGRGANFIAGRSDNTIAAGVGGATIGGGNTHNIQANSSFATIAGGREHVIESDAESATISGGAANRLQQGAFFSVVGGGSDNLVGTNASYGTIGGGYRNIIQTNGGSATIAGGRENTIQQGAVRSSIGGGALNVVGTNASDATIGGGFGNAIQTGGFHATIGGGVYNTNGVENSILGGGAQNVLEAPGYGATLGGGINNRIKTNAKYSTLAGGENNAIEGEAFYTVIGGGRRNTIETNADYSTISGGDANTVRKQAFYSIIGGGTGNSIETNATHSVIGGGSNNTIETNAAVVTIGGGSANRVQRAANYAAIAGGRNNTIGTNATYAAIGGGLDNNIRTNASYAVIGGGSDNIVHTNSGHATIGGGEGNVINTDADYATIPGGRFAKAFNYGQMAYASGRFSADGDAQTSTYVLRRTTTSATELELFLDGSGRRMVMPDNTSWLFDIMVVARSSAPTSAAYKFTGLMVNDGGLLSFLALTTTLVHEDVAAWEVSVAKDVANKALVIKATGAAATTIHWVASVRTVEVAF